MDLEYPINQHQFSNPTNKQVQRKVESPLLPLSVFYQLYVCGLAVAMAKILHSCCDPRWDVIYDL